MDGKRYSLWFCLIYISLMDVDTKCLLQSLATCVSFSKSLHGLRKHLTPMSFSVFVCKMWVTDKAIPVAAAMKPEPLTHCRH